MALKFNHVTDTIDSTGGVITIVGFDPNIPDATTSESGLMSASDKTKLDGIESGAQANDVDSVFGRTGAVTATSGDYTADQIDFTPAGSIAATDVQAAIEELDTEKAALASPTFTGTPAAPTAAVDTNTTQIATTAFVVGQGYAKTTDLADYALLDSPEFTGVPTAPTAAADTDTTQIATTEFVINQGYVKGSDLTTALADYAELAGADFTGAVSAPSISAGTVSVVNGNFSTNGDAQTRTWILRAATTDATQTELLVNGAGRMALTNDSTWFFDVKIVARRTDVDGESAAFTYKGAIDRNTNAASTALVGTVAEEIVARDDVAWVVSVDADTTNGSLRVRVTGEAAKNIRWVAFVTTTEVAG